MEPRFDHADSITSGIAPVTRRQFVQTVGAEAAVASLPASTLAKGETKPKPESLVKTLRASLTPDQKKQVAFDWNHSDPRTGGQGPLRLHVSNNWRLEGPAFVWHWRGAPHVHVWVNVADDQKAKITSRG